MTRVQEAVLRKTPLTEWHRAHGAKLVDFAGWEMPLAYEGILGEHLAVRERVGLFDVSHMGRLFIGGEAAESLLQRLLTNDVKRLGPGQGQYTLALNETGGVLDDLIVFRLEGEFLVIMNASNREKILQHVSRHAGVQVRIAHRSEDLAMLALQGPRAATIMERLAPVVLALRRFEIRRATVAGREMWVSRTGYTGEDGFELYPEAGEAAAVWQAMVEAGAESGLAPCGLGARDGLRLEVGYPLYGHELDETTTPWEAGLGWVVRMDKGDFIGRTAVAAMKERGIPRRLVGFTCAGPGIPRQGCPVSLDGRNIGTVSSGTYSPALKTGIALGILAVPKGFRGELTVRVRQRDFRAEAVKLPFYRSGTVSVVGKTT